MNKGKEKYYGTFGQKLSALRNCYVVIRASSCQEAHDLMWRHLGNDWSMLYEAKNFSRRYYPGGAVTLSQAKAAIGQYRREKETEVMV